MNGGIFLIQGAGQLVEMKEKPYDSEDMLQELLAKYPNLLAGDQMDATAPRRWLLVTREMGVPDEEDGRDRWSLDHLFLDQDAIPTLIEVKRSNNTQIRREVVGQMLDYAANAVVYWPVDAIRAKFEQGCQRRGADPAKELEAFLGQGAGVEEFWQRVKLNLQAGRVRMVFVADAIPPELRRIVEFLNGQMDPGEVLAVEIKQFVGQGLQTLVPRVMGQTAEAEKKKGPASHSGKQWEEESFFAELRRRPDGGYAAEAKRVYDWSRQAGLRIHWGGLWNNGAFYPVLDHNGREFSPVAGRTGFVNAYLELRLGKLKDTPPFDNPAKRGEFVNLLNTIPGVSIKEEECNKFPSVRLAVLSKAGSLDKFLEVLEWAYNQVRAT
jgi:hypothetical protein